MSFFLGSIIKMSSFRPIKKRIKRPAIIYLSSLTNPPPAMTIVERINPAKTATPPNNGVLSLCEDLPFGFSFRPERCATLTIVGIACRVIRRETITPAGIAIQAGMFKEIKLIEDSIELLLGQGRGWGWGRFKDSKIQRFKDSKIVVQIILVFNKKLIQLSQVFSG
jgi:hypothetical protein